jgi:CheY-like chemotaxis protein
LDELGYQTRVAHDGRSALKLAADAAPDVALLDLGLPVMDGYELAGRLRRVPGLEQLRLVAVTGYGDESHRKRTHDAGFDAHLLKPVDAVELDATIRKSLPPG